MTLPEQEDYETVGGLVLSCLNTIPADGTTLDVETELSLIHIWMLKETGEFVINLTTEKLVRATDYCGVKSGRDTDKWKETGLTPIPAQEVNVPLIKESPVNIECRVSEIRAVSYTHLDVYKRQLTNTAAGQFLQMMRINTRCRRMNPLAD